MNYLTNYYKNLCEQLQERINVLEAQLNEGGLKKALKTEDPELLKKEEQKASARRERYLGQAEEAGKKMMQAQRKFGASAKEVGPPALEHELKHEQARKVTANLNKIEDAKERNLTPNVYDGPDADDLGSSSEVVDAQQQNQMTGNLKPSALETSGMFPNMKGMLDRLTIRKK